MTIECPSCHGKGKVDGFANGGPDLSLHYYGSLPCFRCKSTGRVPKAMPDWMAGGRRLRLYRAANNITLRQMAKAMGLTIAEVSAMDNGRSDPTPALSRYNIPDSMPDVVLSVATLQAAMTNGVIDE
ncbi:helix-turn-helix domain-containing protein [Aeromonas sp. Y311-2]|uniref:helix-turn-helix domain-containing protein n=1 Tax=Aeromonas sp. Y311-2 TaxID=2990507 RepID=UPI0022E7AD39|nr:hypothetical protein [Aeromonas sp. Y311-2]